MIGLSVRFYQENRRDLGCVAAANGSNKVDLASQGASDNTLSVQVRRAATRQL